MDEFCKRLGAFVIAAAMFAIPILCTCSFALGWDTWDTTTPLVLLTILDYIATWWCVMVTIKNIMERLNEH